MQTASWRSHGTHAGRPGTPGVGSDCPAALPSLAWLRVGTAAWDSSPRPTAPTSRGGRFRRSDSTFSPVARCRALPSVHAPQSPVPCVHLRPPEAVELQLEQVGRIIERLLAVNGDDRLHDSPRTTVNTGEARVQLGCTGALSRDSLSRGI